MAISTDRCTCKEREGGQQLNGDDASLLALKHQQLSSCVRMIETIHVVHHRAEAVTGKRKRKIKSNSKRRQREGERQTTLRLVSGVFPRR